MEREKSLIDQWVCLTEERNAVLVPAAGTGIPGAPADWSPPSGMEQHVPVIFLDLNGKKFFRIWQSSMGLVLLNEIASAPFLEAQRIHLRIFLETQRIR